jgi:putative ABC transport system permease protein
MIGTRRVDAVVWGVPDFAHQPIDQVITSARPGPGEVLVDAQDAAARVSSARAGDQLPVQGIDGRFRSLRVAGSARGMAFNQDAVRGHLVLYAPEATVRTLGGLRGVNLLELHLHNASRPAATATADAVRHVLAAPPTPVAFSDVPTIRAPGDWPFKDAFNQRSKVLDILVVLAVLSATFLLANTMRTLVAEQEREIGVMRAVGAGKRDIQGSYLRTAALLGLFGALLGSVLGIGLAFVLVRLFAQVIFGVTPAFAIAWPIVVVGAVAGVVGAVLTAWPTLRRVMRTPVHEALASEGLASSFGGGRLDRAVLHASALPTPMRIGVRNVARQKGRSMTTIVQVALAVATLLGLLSLALAVSEVTDQSWDVLAYDVTLSAQPGGPLYTDAVARRIAAQPGVAGVEPADWSFTTYHGQTLYTLGVHANTFVHEPVAAGRWLRASDDRTAARVAVVGSAAARRWHLHPGSRMTVATMAGPAAFTVIGVGGSDADNGYNLYTSLPALQKAVGHPGVFDSLLVRSDDHRHHSIDLLAARLDDSLGRSGYASRTQIMYTGRATDKAQARTMLVIVEAIGLLIVAISMLGLVNAITMNIIERTREIGVLRCLGARARDLRWIFRTETTVLAVVGFLLAIPLGWVIAHALQWLVLRLVGARLPAPYPIGALGLALAGTLLLAVAVVAAPLRRATHLRPGDAIRDR